MSEDKVLAPTNEDVIELSHKLKAKREQAVARAQQIQMADSESPVSGLLQRVKQNKKSFGIAGVAAGIALALS